MPVPLKLTLSVDDLNLRIEDMLLLVVSLGHIKSVISEDHVLKFAYKAFRAYGQGLSYNGFSWSCFLTLSLKT